MAFLLELLANVGAEAAAAVPEGSAAAEANSVTMDPLTIDVPRPPIDPSPIPADLTPTLNLPGAGAVVTPETSDIPRMQTDPLATIGDPTLNLPGAKIVAMEPETTRHTPPQEHGPLPEVRAVEPGPDPNPPPDPTERSRAPVDDDLLEDISEETIRQWVRQEPKPKTEEERITPRSPGGPEYERKVAKIINHFIRQASEGRPSVSLREKILDAHTAAQFMREDTTLPGASDSLMLRDAEHYLWGRTGLIKFEEDWGRYSGWIGWSGAKYGYGLFKEGTHVFNTLLEDAVAAALTGIPTDLQSAEQAAALADWAREGLVPHIGRTTSSPASAAGGDDWRARGEDHADIDEQKGWDSNADPELITELPNISTYWPRYPAR